MQIDTISVIARSHDLTLWGRVADYRPEHLDTLMYADRRFFDYGRILMAWASDELPYWQAVMGAQRDWVARREAERPETFAHVRDEIRRRGPLANRDFAARERIPGGFRTVKDTGHALYRLWLGGEVMTHSRRGFERVHDLFENVAGRPFGSDAAPLPDAERFLGLKAARDAGLFTASEWARRASAYLQRNPGPKEAVATLDALVRAGELAAVTVEGLPGTRYLPAADLPLLADLDAGRVPAAWTPLGTTTHDEVNFLAPLDNVVWDRPRLRALFDFDYIWEVYKPEALRRWGYYTLPILYGDRLAARAAFRLDRKAGVLAVEGFWPEDESLRSDRAFLSAFERGLARLASFHGGASVARPGVGKEGGEEGAARRLV